MNSLLKLQELWLKPMQVCCLPKNVCIQIVTYGAQFLISVMNGLLINKVYLGATL